MRDDLDNPYALASRRTATVLGPADGSTGESSLFVRLTDEPMVDQHRQAAIRDALEDHWRFVTWDEDGRPRPLHLAHYPDRAGGNIDPRFAWRRPVIASSKIPVDAVVELWHAGDPMDVVAEEVGSSRDVIEDISRIAA